MASDESDCNAAIVIDNGSCFIKAGMGGEESPSVICRTVLHVSSSAEPSVGREAFSKSDSLRRPIERGLITDWNDMEKIWHHIFYNELQVDPREHLVLLTEPPINPKINRENTAQIMFETFEVPGVHLVVQAVLSFFACGRTTGAVIDCGDGVTSIVPIQDGLALPNVSQRWKPAGSDLTDYLGKILLDERGVPFVSPSDRETVREIKENLCYVAFDFEREMQRLMQPDEAAGMRATYQLPDGQVLTLGHERFRCAEAIFQPSFLGLDSEGLPDVVYRNIALQGLECRRELLHNILLAGGTATLPGFRERLEKDLTNIGYATDGIRVIEPPDGKYSTWVGGSILSSLPSFQPMWTSREDYNENGPQIIHLKN